MRILLLCHGFNSLTQRLFVDLRAAGHSVSVEFDINDAVTVQAVALARPDVVIAPFLKRRIPEPVWRAVPCLVVHPGPPGDRGPSALDWAVLEGAETWGVTVLQATDDLDGGPVWASASFPVRAATKSSLYRHEVTEAAVGAVFAALDRLTGGGAPQPAPPGRWRPLCRRADRAVEWAGDDAATVVRKIRSADGVPGAWGELFGVGCHLHDAHLAPAHLAPGLAGPPGTVLGRRAEALCVAAADGAVWVGAVRRPDAEPPLKLPAARAFAAEAAGLPELDQRFPGEPWYEVRGAVGYLHFPVLNGALSAATSARLLALYRAAAAGPEPVLVLMGGPDFWCNGIDLNTIEAAASPAEESWRAINAIDDLAQAIITTTGKLTVAALRGNAGAGGCFLALACDRVWARPGVVLNPHYKGMGNLYGSEYWTYLLPRRCGADNAAAITHARLPMGVAEAMGLGLIDGLIADDAALAEAAAGLAADRAGLAAALAVKAAARETDEAAKPLAAYRAEELERMRLNFFGFDPSYHVARHNFVLKVEKSRTPVYLATHRA